MEQVPYFRPAPIAFSEIEQDMRGIVDSRIYTKGVFRDRLEEALRERLNVNHAITCASGTAALWIAMRVMRQTHHGKYITMSAFNWQSDSIAAESAGYKVEYVDIDPDTWLSERWVPVASPHLSLDTFGSIDTSDCPGDMVVCDATHSVGMKGIWDRGIACCGSMAPTKNLTSGEGGFIACEDNRVAQRCTGLRDLCSRLPEMNCILALESLSNLDDRIRSKKKIADYYRKHLPYQFQKIPYDSTHSKICFLCDESEELIERAAKNGVECRKYYQPLLHDMPHSSHVYDRIVCLPAWVGVDVKRVVAAIETIN